jgi:hypothetical protein
MGSLIYKMLSELSESNGVTGNALGLAAAANGVHSWKRYMLTPTPYQPGAVVCWGFAVRSYTSVN